MTAATVLLAQTLTDLPDAPAPVQRAVLDELLYALGLATRPDPEPTPDDDGPWCQTEVTQ